MKYKKGDTIRPAEHARTVGTWVEGRYRIHLCAFLFEKEGRYFLSYLGSPTNRFLGEEVLVEVEESDFNKGILAQLDWNYFYRKYVTT